jgi:hypothetical protein
MAGKFIRRHIDLIERQQCIECRCRIGRSATNARGNRQVLFKRDVTRAAAARADALSKASAAFRTRLLASASRPSENGPVMDRPISPAGSHAELIACIGCKHDR